jgi:hypothetical protein
MVVSAGFSGFAGFAGFANFVGGLITELFLTHKWCCYVRGLRENSQFDDPMEE